MRDNNQSVFPLNVGSNRDFSGQFQQSYDEGGRASNQMPKGYLSEPAIQVSKQKGTKKQSVMYVVSLVFSILALIVSFGNYGGSKKSESDKQTTNVVSEKPRDGETGVVASEAEGVVESEATEEVSGAYRVGDDISVKTDNGEYIITFTSVQETDDRNMFTDKKPNRVILVDFTLKNVDYELSMGTYSNNEISVNSWDVEAYDVDGEQLDTYPICDNGASGVSPGHKTSGQFAFCLDNDENYIELEYKTNLFESADLVVELTW